MAITDGGQVIRTRVSELRESGRNTQGVRVIRLTEGEHVVDVEPLEVDEDEHTGTTQHPPPPSEPPEGEARSRDEGETDASADEATDAEPPSDDES
jgi:DNA gyrase subunit A